MTVCRSLALERTSAGLRLAQKPVDELRMLREEPPLVFPGDLSQMLTSGFRDKKIFPNCWMWR